MSGRMLNVGPAWREEPTFHAHRIVEYLASEYGDDPCLLEVSLKVKELMDSGIDVNETHVDKLFRSSQIVQLRQWLQEREAAKEQAAKNRIKSPGFVYFILHGDQIKIGHSIDPATRAKSLSLRPSDVIAVIEGTQALERSLHKKFSEHRIGNTEWFHDCPEIREHIRTFGQPLTRHHRSRKNVGPVMVEDAYIRLAQSILGKREG
jgi:hypothetical protein